MDLDLRLVRAFLAVVEAGSYGRAAGTLHVAVPSLSQQMRKLEHQLGCVLLDRDRTGTRLTADGEEFVPLARELLAVQDRATAIGPRRRRADAALLRLGFLTGVAGPLTRPLLDGLAGAAPSARVELVQVDWAEQVDVVLDGRVDAVFARPPLRRADVVREPVWTEPRVAVLSRRRHLAGRAELRIADLAGVVQPTAEGDPEWVRWWSVDPRPDGTPVRYGPLVHSIEEMLEVVAATDVVAITGASVAGVHQRPDLAFVPIVDVEPTTITLVLPRTPPGPLVRCLVDLVRALRPAP